MFECWVLIVTLVLHCKVNELLHFTAHAAECSDRVLWCIKIHVRHCTTRCCSKCAYISVDLCEVGMWFPVPVIPECVSLCVCRHCGYAQVFACVSFS